MQNTYYYYTTLESVNVRRMHIRFYLFQLLSRSLAENQLWVCQFHKRYYNFYSYTITKSLKRDTHKPYL